MTRPKLTPDLASATVADPQEKLEPFDVELPGHTMRVYHGDVAFVGRLGDGKGVRIVMMAGSSGCGCGCGFPGRGFVYTPSVDHARLLAAQLIEQADAIEHDAAQAAGDALQRAARR